MSHEQSRSLGARVAYLRGEARTLLANVAVLLGFQFVIMLDGSFGQLPDSSKLTHMWALALVALTVILLATPAVLSVRADDGRTSRQIGAWLVGAALALGLGVGADTYVAITEAAGSATAGLFAAAAIMLLLGVLMLPVTS